MRSASGPGICTNVVEQMDIEVAYALPAEQVIVEVQVPGDCTIREAIQRSGLLAQYPDIDLEANRVGIFGKLAKLDDPLHAGDRVEIYRVLIADPKEARKRRAAQGKNRLIDWLPEAIKQRVQLGMVG